MDDLDFWDLYAMDALGGVVDEEVTEVFDSEDDEDSLDDSDELYFLDPLE